MTVKEFSEICHSPIKVMSAFNGKVLCYRYKPEKHTEIADREIISVWCEIQATKPIGYNNIATATMCVYVYGDKECKKVCDMEVK